MTWGTDFENKLCLFAIDASSIIDTTSKTVSLVNTVDNFLTYTEGTVSYQKKSGDNATDFTRKISGVKTYECLRLDESILTFFQNIPVYSDHTLVLKCFINGNTKLGGSTAIGNQPYGLSFSTDYFAAVYLNNWRVFGLETGSDFADEIRYTNPYILHDVVVKFSYTQNTVTIVTDYGIYSKPMETSVSNGYDMNTIGFIPQPETKPKLDIVGYAMYSGILTDIEIASLYTSLDEKSLIISKSIVSAIDISALTAGYTREITTGVNKDLSMKRLLNYSESIVGSIGKTVKEFTDLSTISTLYDDLYDITDVVLEEGLPVQAPIYLHERTSGRLIKTTVSDLKGNFKFFNLSKNLNHVITAHDDKYQYKSILKNYNN